MKKALLLCSIFFCCLFSSYAQTLSPSSTTIVSGQEITVTVNGETDDNYVYSIFYTKSANTGVNWGPDANYISDDNIITSSQKYYYPNQYPKVKTSFKFKASSVVNNRDLVINFAFNVSTAGTQPTTKQMFLTLTVKPATVSIFYNTAKSQAFTRNNCSTGYVGSSVTYSVPANKYSSTVSQADADAKAQAEVTANGQNNANTNGSCSIPNYGNAAISKDFIKNDCTGGYVGSLVTYTVPASKYISHISQADADAQAQAEVDANGQANANAKGICSEPHCVGGLGAKFVNGKCEVSAKIYTGSAPRSPRGYTCTYHYEWSDGTRSIDYTEDSLSPCPIQN